MTISYILIFIFGLFIGSFLNVVILRARSNEKFLFGRSHCPLCKTTLKWFDLIPLFSFILLKGRCRYCRKKISWQYPLVEAATGILFALFLWRTDFFVSFEDSPDLFFLTLFYYCFYASILIIVFVYDLRYYLILDRIIFGSIFISLPAITFMPGVSPGKAVLASLLGSGFLFLVLIFTKGKGMGAGDVKLSLLLGLMLSFPFIIIAFFLAFLMGAVVGVVLIALKKKNLKSKVPFGTFLSAAAIITLLLGREIIAWYWTFVV